ncbi:MAG: hydrolase [Gammaproteobacteria bacterium]|nr:hydrolase [Gammaproteobacteria bacterium]
MIINSSFKPGKFLRNPHLQSMLPTILTKRWPSLTLQRERVELSDGDFVDLAWHGTATHQPIVLLIHGMTGDHNAAYVKYLMPMLVQKGWRPVLIYYRGFSGEQNRFDRITHAGRTDDIGEVIRLLQQREPDTKIAAVGFSQGANMLLKYLGETKDASGLTCSIAISPPFQLRSIANRIRQGAAKFYQWYLLRNLRKFYRQKYRSRVAPFRLSALPFHRSFWTFDEHVTAPLHGFKSAVDYYKHASCIHYLPTIRTPTLIIHAKDDPMMAPDIIPTETQISQSVQLEITQYGGHLGFLSGSFKQPKFWLAERIPEFLAHYI